MKKLERADILALAALFPSTFVVKREVRVGLFFGYPTESSLRKNFTPRSSI